MATKKDIQQYILLPSRGISAANASPAIASFFLSLNSQLLRTAPPAGAVKSKVKMRVLDSIHENGAKLVEMFPGSASDLRAEEPGVKLVPVTYHYPAVAPRPTVESRPKLAAAAARTGIVIAVVSGADGTPVVGATVVAFTDFAGRVGAQGTTNSKGQVSLALGASSKKVERLYVYSQKGFWNVLNKNVVLQSGKQIKLTPLDLGYTDALRHFYGNSADGEGNGIKVGVIDTGIAAHPDLTIDGGRNTVTGEDPNDFRDNGEGHGTHVAGIIAAHGTPPSGVRGLAPGVVLRSYRVFGKGQPGASNFAIAKAVDLASSDGCDLINMSLGGGPADDATQAAIADARARGCLLVIAAGNDGRKPVSFPASDSLAIAVSALGRRGAFPSGSVATWQHRLGGTS